MIASHVRPTMHPALRILIVDDEPHVRKFLRLTLQADSYNVLEATTAEEALTLIHEANPDLMILDLGLPDIDGQQVIRDVRLKSDLPIIVLSGRTEDSEKIVALEHGADDYLTKPFAMGELLGRVKMALDHSGLRSNQKTIDSVETGSLHIDLRASQVKRDRSPVTLDAEEYALLRLLALHGGRVVTIGHLERALWGKDSDKENSNTHQQLLQKRIGGLRRKLEAEPSFPRYIVTEPAVGYRLEILPPDAA